MEQKKTSKPYSPEFRDRAVRLFMGRRQLVDQVEVAGTG